MMNYAITETYNNENIAKKFLNISNSFVLALKKYQNYEIIEVTSNDINYLMEYINENKKRIEVLLKTKKSFDVRIDALMSLHTLSASSISKSQMKAYKNYNIIVKKENPIIDNCFKIINNRKYIKEIINSVTLDSDNLNNLYNKLNNYVSAQNKAIISLTKIINKAKKTAKIL